jgi:hypothetical protein
VGGFPLYGLFSAPDSSFITTLFSCFSAALQELFSHPHFLIGILIEKHDAEVGKKKTGRDDCITVLWPA